MAAAVDHTYILLGKAERMDLSFCVVRMEHLVFLILPLYLEERYAGKNIRRNIAAATLGFMSVDASTIRPDPFALPNGAIPNASTLFPRTAFTRALCIVSRSYDNGGTAL